MTDNEIIKALECCKDNARGHREYKYIRLCDIEKYEGWGLAEIIPAKFEEYFDMCVICKDDTTLIDCELINSVLDLIKNQKAELKQYAQEQHDLMIEKDELFDIAEKQKTEIEEYEKKFVEIHEGIKEVKSLYLKDIAKAKAEAIKEFVKRLRAKCCAPYWLVWLNDVDDVLEEMVGEDNA